MKKIYLFIRLWFVTGMLWSQPGSLDVSFNPQDNGTFGYGANGPVNSISIQPNNKIIISGGFMEVNGVYRHNIARLNPDGSLDPSFNLSLQVTSSVETSTIQPDGKIIIGGLFNSVNGTSRKNIARLNSDGSLDTTFNPGSGVNYAVKTTAIQSDGKIIIGGDFTSVNGTNGNYIARLNSDGSLDTTFNPGSGADGIVLTIAIQLDGKIIIGGQFTNVNGTSRNYIARLNSDGSLDTTFNPGASGDVRTTAIQSDGKIIIGGGFLSVNGTSRSRIARLNSNGSLDTTFNPSSGTNSTVYTTAIQSDGKIIIGGLFTSVNGTLRSRIARLNSNGSLDTTFDPGSGANDIVLTTAIQPDGKIIIGGLFASVNGTSRKHIARLNSDGSLDTNFNPGKGVNYSVQTTTIQSDGKIIIGGQFTSVNGTNRNYIARMNSDGSLDTTFNPGLGANDIVLTTAIQSDGKIIIGGTFTSVNGTSRNYIARLNSDGSLDPTFNPGSGPNNDVWVTTIQSDGKIIIGGYFTSVSGTSRSRIARLNSNGSLDTTFNPDSGMNDVVLTTAIQPDGKVIIGGDFTSVNGTNRRRIARLNSDGSLDTTFNPGSGANETVFSTTIQPDGKIILGGIFTSVNNTPRNSIARLNSDGSLDTTFNPGSGVNGGSVWTTAIQSDGKVIIGGRFLSVNGAVRYSIARLNSDGSLDTTFNPGSGTNNFVYTSAIQSDGKIIIGGDFTNYDSQVKHRIARINGGSLLSSNENTLTTLKIFPNPASSFIHITTEISTLEIFDITGKKVKSFEQVNNPFDVSDLQKGVYIIKGTNASGQSFTNKLIKE